MRLLLLILDISTASIMLGFAVGMTGPLWRPLTSRLGRFSVSLRMVIVGISLGLPLYALPLTARLGETMIAVSIANVFLSLCLPFITRMIGRSRKAA